MATLKEQEIEQLQWRPEPYRSPTISSTRWLEEVLVRVVFG
jgi:hypothetical protein